MAGNAAFILSLQSCILLVMVLECVVFCFSIVQMWS